MYKDNIICEGKSTGLGRLSIHHTAINVCTGALTSSLIICTLILWRFVSSFDNTDFQKMECMSRVYSNGFFILLIFFGKLFYVSFDFFPHSYRDYQL